MSRGTSRAAPRQPSQRQLRVGELIRHALAGVLMRGDLHDPVLQSHAITVTEVQVGPDLRNATVYVMPLGGSDADEVMAALGHAAAYLRGRVSHELDLRVMPRLSFALDRTFDEADRIERVLQDPRVRRDVDTGAAEDPEGESGDGA